MKLLGDYHTHTVYTHGKGTIEDNVKQAINLGLKEIAITEHCYSHMFTHIWKKDYAKMKAEIELLREKYPEIKIYFGMEANLISCEGDSDISEDERKGLDMMILGYHKLFWAKRLRDYFLMFIPNLLKFGSFNKKLVERNTEAYLKAMDKYDINILAHLKYGNCLVDVKKIAEKAKEKHIYIELNGRRILFTPKEIQDMVDTGVKFIVDSDAHDPLDVGRNHRGINIIEKYNIPISQVANIDKLPDFTKKTY